MPRKHTYTACPSLNIALRSGKGTSLEATEEKLAENDMSESRKGHFLYVVVLLLFACLQLGLGMKQRLNYGTVFVEKGEITLSSKQWKHTFLIDIHLQKPDISFKVDCENCDYLKKMYPQIAQIYHSATDEINDMMNHINKIVPEHGIVKNRSRRSLLPFVGSLGKSLFGFAVTADVEKITKSVNLVIRKTNYLSNAFVKTNDMLASFMQSTDDRLSNVFKTMQYNHELLKNLSLQLNETYQLHEQQHIIQNSFMKMKLFTERLRRSYNKLLVGCNELIEGRLPEILIPYNVLASTIENITHHVKMHNYKLFTEDPLFYYKNGQFQFFRFNKKLYINLIFPMVQANAKLFLYEILTYPVPINQTSTHVSKVSNVPKYLAITKNQNYYVELDSSALYTCKLFQAKWLCSYNIALTPMDYKQCAISIFVGDKKDVQTYCEFHFIPNYLKPSVRQLNETHFIIFNTSSLILDCPSNLKTIQGCNFCLMTIPCNCSLTSINTFIPQRLTRCHHHSTPVTMLYPLNLALLQQFFNKDTLKDIQAHTSFTDVLNVTVPKFEIFQHNYTQSIAKENYEHLNLKKMIEIAKKNNIIYTSLAEPLLQNSNKTDDHFSFEILLAIISMTLSLLSSVALAVFFYRFRNLGTLYASLKAVNKVEASLPSFHYTITTLPQENNDLSVSTFEISPMHVIMFIFGVILLYKILQFCFRKKNCSILILDITNGMSCVQIPIMSLPICVQQYKFTGTNILVNLTVTKFKICPSVCIDFGDLKITDQLMQRELTLPKSVKLNPYKAYSLKTLLQSNFTMCLWLKQGQLCHPVLLQNNSSQCTSTPCQSLASKDQAQALLG